jgi:transcription antitermination factor NusG
LFSGYVFLCGDEEMRLCALQTDRIAKIISVSDQEQLVAELEAVQRLLTSGLDVGPHAALRKGSACRICRGPLAGLEGRVERRRGRARFVVNVSILGQGAMVELDAECLEPAG